MKPIESIHEFGEEINDDNRKRSDYFSERFKEKLSDW